MVKYIVNTLLQHPCVVMNVYTDYNYAGFSVSLQCYSVKSVTVHRTGHSTNSK
jgi:hypothetical protein